MTTNCAVLGFTLGASGQFVDCNFDDSMCGWTLSHSHHSFFWFHTSSESCQIFGFDCPEERSGKFIHLDPSDGESGDKATLSTEEGERAEGCLTFSFSIFQEGNVKELKILAEDNVIWQLTDFSLDNRQWTTGQAPFKTSQLTFEAVHSSTSLEGGYAAVDDFVFNLESSENCPVTPPEAAVEPTEEPPTTSTAATAAPTGPTQPSDHSQFTDCNFDDSMCGWTLAHDHHLFFWFHTSQESCEIFGFNCPSEGSGKFLHLNPNEGEPGDNATISTGSGDSARGCVVFYFSSLWTGNVEALKIQAEDLNGNHHDIWRLSDPGVDTNGGWQKFQAPFNANGLVFEASHSASGTDRGYIAIDDISFDFGSEAPSCPVMPPEAAVTPTEEPPITTDSPPLTSGEPTDPTNPSEHNQFTDCSFDDSMCGWTLAHDHHSFFWFHTSQESCEIFGFNCPGGVSALAAGDGKFLYLNPDNGAAGDNATISTEAGELASGCMVFYYSAVWSGNFETLRIRAEDLSGGQEIIWELSSPGVDTSLPPWKRFQAPFNTNKLVIEASHSESTEPGGFLAIDDVSFSFGAEAAGCPVLPHEANVGPTTASGSPTDGTTSSRPTNPSEDCPHGWFDSAVGPCFLFIYNEVTDSKDRELDVDCICSTNDVLHRQQTGRMLTKNAKLKAASLLSPRPRNYLTYW